MQAPILFPNTAPGTPHALINIFESAPYGCKLDEGSVSCMCFMRGPIWKRDTSYRVLRSRGRLLLVSSWGFLQILQEVK